MALVVSPVRPAFAVLDEYDVKAAYLYNFAKLVEWPDSLFAQEDTSFVIVLVGTDPFGAKLDDRFRGRRISGRSIRIDRVAHLHDLPACQVLYLALSDEAEAVEILKWADGHPVLTVGDHLPIAQQGGIVNFYLEEEAVRFEMSPAAIERSRLSVSSKLLSLARITKGGR